MRTHLMLVETTFGGVSIAADQAADRALEGPLPRVLPLLRNEPLLILEHPPAEVALELESLWMVNDVRFQMCGVDKPLAAVLTI